MLQTCQETGLQTCQENMAGRLGKHMPSCSNTSDSHCCCKCKWCRQQNVQTGLQTFTASKVCHPWLPTLHPAYVGISLRSNWLFLRWRWMKEMDREQGLPHMAPYTPPCLRGDPPAVQNPYDIPSPSTRPSLPERRVMTFHRTGWLIRILIMAY